MHIRGEEVLQLLFGHHFNLATDHKPLLRLLSEEKPTSPQASARIRRWSLFLSRFEYISQGVQNSIYDGCVPCGNSVLIPMVYRQAVLTQLHNGHLEMAKMKAMSRMFDWWPGILSETEALVQQCHTCQLQHCCSSGSTTQALELAYQTLGQTSTPSRLR